MFAAFMLARTTIYGARRIRFENVQGYYPRRPALEGFSPNQHLARGPEAPVDPAADGAEKPLAGRRGGPERPGVQDRAGQPDPVEHVPRLRTGLWLRVRAIDGARALVNCGGCAACAKSRVRTWGRAFSRLHIFATSA